jgi:hypothetical protein
METEHSLPHLLDHILSQINPIHTFLSYEFKINCNITWPYTLRSNKQLFFPCSSNKFTQKNIKVQELHHAMIF